MRLAVKMTVKKLIITETKGWHLNDQRYAHVYDFYDVSFDLITFFLHNGHKSITLVENHKEVGHNVGTFYDFLR